LTLLGMIGLFTWQSLPVWRSEGVLGFLTGDQWFFRGGRFGLWSMLFGTFAVAGVAMLLAVPVGVGAAIFSSEYLRPRPRLMVKALVELLAGVPSVVYGLLGILILRGWIYEGLNLRTGDTLLTGGVLLGIMVLPTVMTLADDALQAVPVKFRRASRGLGLTRAETILHAVLPQARAGILAAVLLGFGRAIGETIAVFLVIGRQDNRLPTWDALLSPGQTLTAKLGGSELNIAYGDSLHWGAMMGVALVLLLISTAVTLLGRRLILRK
jgi:phosphate transport system permease protein